MRRAKDDARHCATAHANERDTGDQRQKTRCA
jgi:hypothetical protein